MFLECTPTVFITCNFFILSNSVNCSITLFYNYGFYHVYDVQNPTGGGVEKIYFNPQSSWSTGCAWANYFQYISQMWWHMISRNIWLKKGCFLCYCDYVVYRWHCWRPKFFIWRYLFMVIGALWFNEMKNFFRVNLRPSQCLWEFSCKWEFFLQILRELWFYGINFVTFFIYNCLFSVIFYDDHNV